jgi:hypothetical protein
MISSRSDKPRWIEGKSIYGCQLSEGDDAFAIHIDLFKIHQNLRTSGPIMRALLSRDHSCELYQESVFICFRLFVRAAMLSLIAKLQTSLMRRLVQGCQVPKIAFLQLDWSPEKSLPLPRYNITHNETWKEFLCSWGEFWPAWLWKQQIQIKEKVLLWV